MPLNVATMTAALSSSLVGGGLNGSATSQLAQGISQGLVSYLRTVPITTNHVGVLGSGSGTGTVLVNPALGIPLLTASMISQEFKGVSAPTMASSIVLGIAADLNAQGQFQVVVAGSSTGSGTGTLSGVSSSPLTASLTLSFAQAGLGGPKAPELASALAQGLSAWLQTGVLITVDVGTPVFPFGSSTGVGTGFFI